MPLTSKDTYFLYVYGVTKAEKQNPLEISSITGIDQQSITLKKVKDIAALITPVNAYSFSQSQIDLQLKDAEWLKEKAFHHHQLIATLDENFTIVPMPFCTIFQNEESLENVLTKQHDTLLEKLLAMQGKKEWNVKLFCLSEKALSYVFDHNPAVMELREKLPSMPKGKQFLMKKKLEQLISSEFELEQSRWWGEVMEQLTPIVTDASVRQNWGKDVTERKDEMITNCDFLVDQNKIDQFLNKIEEIEQRFKALGCTFHVTGPWPPYHFSKIPKETR
jgi:hypothetical protein